MPRRPVFTSVIEVLEQRIARGDYLLKNIPGERKLAQEVGVSYMTARKAVLHLIERQVLTRRPNGTLDVHPRLHGRVAPPAVALLTPAYPSSHLVRCRLEVMRAAEAAGARFRPVEYFHWHDPIVREALDGSDGLVVIPSTEPIPDRLLADFASTDHKVVFFDQDMTAHGIPSVTLFSSDHLWRLLDHVHRLGHTSLHCLNAQGHNEEIERRIGEWRRWCAARGVAGDLWDHPAPPFTDPMSQGYEAMRRIFEAEDVVGDAIVCTTQPAALGAIRACHEAGLDVGTDVSVCTMNNEPTGRYFCPSLTGLEMPDVAPLLARCFAWFAGAERPWQGPLNIAPHSPVVLDGESTGPPPASRSGGIPARARPRRTRRPKLPNAT